MTNFCLWNVLTTYERSTINNGKSSYFTLGACDPGEHSHMKTLTAILDGNFETNPKKNQTPVLWAWLECFSPQPKRYQTPV